MRGLAPGGRGSRLLRDGTEILLKDWAKEIIEDVRAIAEMLDSGDGGDAYVQAVDAQAALVEQPDATPSARVLQDMRDNGTGFYHFAMERAVGHKDYFASLTPLEGDRLSTYVDEAADSLNRQSEIEASDKISFDEYLKQYYSEQGCSDCP